MPNINYDKNGNILNLQRNGKVNSNTYGAIDNLSYSYSGNRLTAVSDAVSGNHEVDFVPRGSGAYTYWENGALKSDENKEIINITYNTYLNKPDEIQLTDGRWIKMTYDGSGALIKREFSTGEYWEYTNGIIFKNGNFYSLGIPDGRAIFEGGNWKYEFFYQDHLGNTRVTFAADGNTLVKKDATDFEPFGTRLNGTGTTNSFENRHLYQNKETLQLFGLENINDFGARYVDRSIGRFLDIDLMATEFPSWSPYHYLHNSPVNLVDPTGMFAEDPGVPGGKTKNDPIAQGFMNFGSRVWSFGKALVNNPRETLGNMASGAAQSLGNFARQDGGNLANASRRVAGEAYSGYVARLAASGDPAYESQVVLGELAAEATVGALLTRGATSLASRGAVETIADVGASAAVKGVGAEGAVWAQKTFSGTFSAGGKFAGKTVDNVAGMLRGGTLSAADVPINVVVRNGQTFILNTRSSAALMQAGIPRNSWNIVNQTGISSFESMLTGQLGRNGLVNGTNNIRQSGTQLILSH